MEVLGVPANYDVEIHFLQFSRDRSRLSIGDGAVVQLDYGRQMGRGTGEEDLVSQIQFAAVYGALHHLHSQFPLGQLDDGLAGNAGQHVVFQRRSDKPPVDNHKDVFAGAFAYVAVVVEDDGLVEPGQGGLGLGQDAVDVNAANLQPGPGIIGSSTRRQDEVQQRSRSDPR